ncbi:MAG: hypothetical protein V7642_1758, partial [Burkholderiales bacterium]
MADPEKTGRKDEEAARQASRQAEAIRRPPDTMPTSDTTVREATRAQAASAGATTGAGASAAAAPETQGMGGRAQEGVTRMIGGAERMAGATVSG